MSTHSANQSPGGLKLAVFGIGIVGAFLIMGYIVRGMYFEHSVGPVNHARGAERLKVRMELTAKAQQALTNSEPIDPARGIIRLPIDRAVAMTLEAYQQGGIHSNLVARSQKAQAPAPQQSFE